MLGRIAKNIANIGAISFEDYSGCTSTVGAPRSTSNLQCGHATPLIQALYRGGLARAFAGSGRSPGVVVCQHRSLLPSIRVPPAGALHWPGLACQRAFRNTDALNLVRGGSEE
jgi:hypothetical protein